MPNVSNLVKTIQDIMRKDAGTYGDAQRLEQLGWMFFLKIFDDREKEMEDIRDNYRSPLPKHLRWSTWASDDEGITGEALLDFVNNTLLPKLKALTGGGDKIAGLIRMAFEDANNYMKNGTLMRQVALCDRLEAQQQERETRHAALAPFLRRAHPGQPQFPLPQIIRHPPGDLHPRRPRQTRPSRPQRRTGDPSS